MSNFDFRRWAYNANGNSTDLEPPNKSIIKSKIERRVVESDLEDEEENDQFLKTRSGRRIQTINDQKELVSTDESEEDEDEDEFKMKSYGKSKRTINKKPKTNGHDITNNFVTMKKSNKLSKIDDKYDSSPYVPLKKSNRSITIKNDNSFKPLKLINNRSEKGLKDEITSLLDDDDNDSEIIIKRKRKRLSDEEDDTNDSFERILKRKERKIARASDDEEESNNRIIPINKSKKQKVSSLRPSDEDDTNDSFNKISKKERKIARASDDEDESNLIVPVRKQNKKKKAIISSDEESNDSNNKDENDCPDDIQVILDEEGQSDDDYESDEDILTSDDDDDDEEEDLVDDETGEKKSKIKSKKLQIKEALIQLCNEGKEAELMSITGFNKKSYTELVDLREFKDWSDLINKFEKSITLSTETIDRLSDYIKTKNVITTIMDKCQELSNRIKQSVTNLKEHKEPKCLNKKLKLKPYQLVGLNYLVMMYKQNLNSILADEMGLGKTIQVIALLAYLREECNLYGTHLIVVPSSILSNWEREFELWCPMIKVLKYYGNQEERTQLRYDITTKSVKFDVILTTYNMLYSSDDKKLLTKVKFQYAIFDEAHMLKNMKSSRFRNLFAVKAKYRLMLTGTPIQNNLLELISLLTFTVPNLFYAKLNFMENFFKNKKFDDNKSEFVQEKTDQAKEILKPFILRRIKENVLKELPNKIEQYVTLDMTDDQMKLYKDVVDKYSQQLKLRRERKEREKREKLEDKVEIIEERNRKKSKKEYNEDKIFFIEDLDRPRRTKKNENNKTLDDNAILIEDNDNKKPNGILKYLNKTAPAIEKEDAIEINSESSKSDVWSLDSKEDDKQIKERQGSILMELRKCANHPLLIRNLFTDDLLLKMAQILKKKEPYYQTDGNIKYMIEDMELLNDFDLHMLCKRFPCINQFQLKDDKILQSGKFKYLDNALDDFKKKDQKVLIFSQFVMMLDIIEEYLKIKSIKYCRLDGSTKVTERMTTIDSFKDKEIFVFLLTTKAGGVGINLVEANNVIIHDSDFNPFNDLQAQSRAHRIGQTNEVNVYKLVSNDTVEVHMRQICEEKLSVGKQITNDQIKKDEESSDVKLLLKKALNY